MRKKLYSTIEWLGLGLALLGLMLRSRETIDAAKEGLALCANVIIPSLFPFFVLSSMTVDMGAARALGRLLEPVMRPLFNVSGACGTALALGFVGGYPTGARTAIAIYKGGLCTRTEAERLLAFCNNSGPAFILGVVGAGIFASGSAGLLLYLAHAVASACVGLIFRFYRRKERATVSDAGTEEPSRASLSGAFSAAVTGAAGSTVAICAFVVFFTVAIRLLYLFGILPAAGSVLGLLLSPVGLDSTDGERLLTGLIEISSGVWTLSGAAGSIRRQLALAAFMLGWAGLSVHCQVMSFIGESGLSAKTYIAGKLLHGLISAVLVWMTAGFFQFEAPVLSYLCRLLEGVERLNFGRSLGISLLSCGCVILFLLLLRPNAKIHWKNAKR